MTSRMVLHIVGHFPRRACAPKIFGANRIGTCLVWGNEAFLPGKVTGFQALTAGVVSLSIKNCLDWGQACAGRTHEYSAKRHAPCHSPMGGVGGLRQAYKMSGETSGDVIAFKRLQRRFNSRFLTRALLRQIGRAHV